MKPAQERSLGKRTEPRVAGGGGAAGEGLTVGCNKKGDLHFIQTKSGHLQLIFGPYIFVTDSVRSGRTFWRCMEYGKRCRARITSKNNVLRITNSMHNHTDTHADKINHKYDLGEVVTCPSV